jgi:hypothetical protein
MGNKMIILTCVLLMLPTAGYAQPEAQYDENGISSFVLPQIVPGPTKSDRDGDAIPNDRDNCPEVPNHWQSDLDKDGFGDECDEDMDGDGKGNRQDNCPALFNPDQSDVDKDGLGDRCERDIDDDHDGISNFHELSLGTDPDNPDTDGDGVWDVDELTHGTDPTKSDSNGNGIDDCKELGGIMVPAKDESPEKK